jgi:hypothetical protein
VVAVIALSVRTPTPGIVARRRAVASCRWAFSILRMIPGFVELSAKKVESNTGLRRKLRRRFQQAVDVLPTHRTHDPEPAKMRADSVDDLRHLPDQKIQGTVMQQDRLVLFGLDRHETHERPGHRLADRFRIGGIGFLAFDGRLHTGRRHQPHIVTERISSRSPKYAPKCAQAQAAMPIRHCAMEPKKGQNLIATQLPADDNASIGINTVYLKTILAMSRPIVTISSACCFLVLGLLPVLLFQQPQHYQIALSKAGALPAISGAAQAPEWMTHSARAFSQASPTVPTEISISTSARHWV